MGAHTMGIPCDIGDTVYKVSVKKQDVIKWYVKSIQKNSEEEGWIVVVKDNQNKYKYNERTFRFDCFGEIVFLNIYEAKRALAEYSNPKRVSVICKCGHTRNAEITGTPKYRQSRIDWYSRQLCPECRNIESERKGLPLVEMPYKEYKEKYSHFDTKVGSYDPSPGKKSILVYMEPEK